MRFPMQVILTDAKRGEESSLVKGRFFRSRFFGPKGTALRMTVVLCIFTPVLAFAQKASPGREKVDAAYKFQEKLNDNTATKQEVIDNWSKIAQDSVVRKDPDAWGIAYGCEALLRYQIGQRKEADSVMHRGIGKFRLRKSKAYFLVAFANMDRELKHEHRAMTSYEEILATMDSLPELWDIEYYRLSGYAPFA